MKINQDFRIFVMKEHQIEIQKMLFDMGYSFKLELGKHFNAIEKKDLFYYVDHKNKRISKSYENLNVAGYEFKNICYYELKTLWKKYRHQEGVSRAVYKGKFKGRQETINKTAIRSAMKQKGSTYRNVAKRLNISPSTVYRAMQGYREMDLNIKDRSDEVSKLKKDLETKQEEINQLHMEIQGLKGLIFPENKDVEKISLKLFGHKLKLYKVK